MKKNVRSHQLLRKIIKISLLQIVLVILCASVSLAHRSSEQEVLNKKITLHLKGVEIEMVLHKLEKSAGVNFMYSPELIQSKRKISIEASDRPLSLVLSEIFGPLNIRYEVFGEQILLKRVLASPSNVKEKESSRVEINMLEKNMLEKNVSGVVTNDKNEPIPGVNILIKGTKKGVVSDVNGQYKISVPDEKTILVFSMVGFLKTEVEVVKQSIIDIILQTDNKSLDEVVVVGYGSTSRTKVNSSVSTLNMTNVAPIPVQSINDAIAGRVQGVIVTTSNGAPGTKSQISIRGGGTPLFVIDNIIRTQVDFENLNPNDIDKYSILKDAAATSIYGALGGNGVVLVTTKKGNPGETNINYSFNTIFSQPTILPAKLSSYDRLNAINQVYLGEGKQQPTPDNILQLYKDQSKPFLFPNTDWQKIALRQWAPEQRHDLSISSGTKSLTYYAALSNYHQGSILNTDQNYNDRTTYRLNTVSDFDKVHLKVTTSIDGYVETNSVPISGTANSYSDIFGHVQNSSPTQLAYNQFGLPSSSSAAGSPALELSPLSGYRRGDTKVFNSILGLDYAAPFLNGLHLKVNGNYNTWNTSSKAWNASAPVYADSSKTPIPGNPPSLTVIAGQGTTFILQSFITYSKTFGDHTVDFTGGYEQAQTKYDTVIATRQQYRILFDQFVTGPTVNQLANGLQAQQARASYLGRLEYNYKSKYFLGGTIRYDGNDLFPKGKQWGTFYALSAGWILTEEKFMQSLKENHILDYLKGRGSYGVTGIVDGIGRFQYIPGYNIVPNAWVVNGVPQQGTAEQKLLPSTNFSWYSVASRNFGFDFASINSRLSGSFDYFYMRTTGYVGSDTRFSTTLGIGLPPINIPTAALRREGFEFNLGWNDHIGKLTYKIGFNFTYFNQLWERNPAESDTDVMNPYTRKSGNNQASLLGNGYLNDGYYQNNSDLLNGPRLLGSINTVAGDLRYQDTNGDGKIDANDQRRIGTNTFPRSNFGTTIDLGYKGIYFSAVIMGSGIRDRYIGDVVQGSSAQGYLVYGFQQDYWTPTNPNAPFPRQVSNSGVNGNNNAVVSDFWILKSQYVRLKSVQLGYNLKLGVLKKTAFKQLKVFVSGTNLLTISNSTKYFIDPESDPNNYGYPIQRTLSLGVNVGF